MTRIFVRDRGKITPILVREIERLEAEDDYVSVHARGRRYLVYLPLSEFERRLDAAQFLRIHRAHIVNLDFVSHLEPFDAGRLKVTLRRWNDAYGQSREVQRAASSRDLSKPPRSYLRPAFPDLPAMFLPD